MRHLFWMGALLGVLFVVSASAQATLDTKLSKSTAKPGETITLSADLSGLTPSANQKAGFFVSVRQTPRPGPRPRRRGPRRLGLGRFLGAAPFAQNGTVYTASLKFQIPSRISRDITVNITAATVDMSGPKPALLKGDTEALMIDAP